jgi:RNA polymerase sigma-70 factor (ECF subfamily)
MSSQSTVTPFDITLLAEGHSDALLRRVRQYISDLDDAKDLLQEVWLQVLTRHHQYSRHGSLEGWTLMIARNTSLMELRKPARRPQMKAEAARRWRRWYGSGSHRAQPDSLAIQNEFNRDLSESLAHLSTGQRQAVRLRLLEGRSTAETAAAMGCSQSAVKSYLHRAVLQLRELLYHWRPETTGQNAGGRTRSASCIVQTA